MSDLLTYFFWIFIAVAIYGSGYFHGSTDELIRHRKERG